MVRIGSIGMGTGALMAGILSLLAVTGCRPVSPLLKEVQVEVVRDRFGELNASFVIEVNQEGEWKPRSYGSSDEVFRFTDTSSGTPTSWYWDFGDGAVSTEKSPTHVYATAPPGDSFYNVVLRVGRLDGTSEVIDVGGVVITDAPAVSVIWDTDRILTDGDRQYYRTFEGSTISAFDDSGIAAVYMLEGQVPDSPFEFTVLGPSIVREWHPGDPEWIVDGSGEVTISLDAGITWPGTDAKKNITVVAMENSVRNLAGWTTEELYLDETGPSPQQFLITGSVYNQGNITDINTALPVGGRSNHTARTHVADVNLSGLGLQDDPGGISTSYEVRMWNDGTAPPGIWQSVAVGSEADMNWDLADIAGDRTVYREYRDALGNSTIVSDTIHLHQDLFIALVHVEVTEDGDPASGNPGEISWDVKCHVDSQLAEICVLPEPNHYVVYQEDPYSREIYFGTAPPGYNQPPFFDRAQRGSIRRIFPPGGVQTVELSIYLLDTDGYNSGLEYGDFAYDFGQVHDFAANNDTPTSYTVSGGGQEQGPVTARFTFTSLLLRSD